MSEYESDWHKALYGFRARGECFDVPDSLAKTIAWAISKDCPPDLVIDHQAASWEWDRLVGVADSAIMHQIEDRKALRT